MSLATADIAFLRDLVANQSGHVIAARHAGMMEQRLTPVAGTVGLSDVSSLVRRLRRWQDSELSAQVAEAITVNETSFFRDAHLFNALADRVLPQLISQNSKRKEIRVWCGACSSGQEAYSLAMLFRERFPRLQDWKFRIVASDLCEEMLTKARLGAYSQLDVSRGLPPHQLLRFFDRRGPAWQVKSELQELVEFHRIDLARPWPYLGQFDIVLARNVLLYFDQPTKQDILKRLRGAMRPDSYLFIGAAETLIGHCVAYQRKEIDATVCYCPTTL